jgi:hypothetical protein
VQLWVAAAALLFLLASGLVRAEGDFVPFQAQVHGQYMNERNPLFTSPYLPPTHGTDRP